MLLTTKGCRKKTKKDEGGKELAGMRGVCVGRVAGQSPAV